MNLPLTCHSIDKVKLRARMCFSLPGYHLKRWISGLALLLLVSLLVYHLKRWISSLLVSSLSHLSSVQLSCVARCRKSVAAAVLDLPYEANRRSNFARWPSQRFGLQGTIPGRYLRKRCRQHVPKFNSQSALRNPERHAWPQCCQ